MEGTRIIQLFAEKTIPQNKECTLRTSSKYKVLTSRSTIYSTINECVHFEMNKYSVVIAFFTILGAIISFCFRGSLRRTSSAPYLKESPLFVILTDLTLENTSIIGLLSYVYALLHGACFGAIFGFIVEGAIIGNDPREYTFNENYLTQMVLKILVCVAILVVSRVTIESYVVFIRTAENASDYFAQKRLKEIKKDKQIASKPEIE